MIQELTIAELDPRQIKQLEAAGAAENANTAYALDIYGAVLKQTPGCLELRKKLRALQLKKAGDNTRGFTKFLGKVTASPFRLGGLSEKDPESALNKAEELLDKNPANVAAHQMLAEAAANLDMKATAVFAYETVYKIEPENIQNLKVLGRAYIEAGDTENAIKTGNTILKKSPGDGEAEELMKQASVAVAMHKGKWEESEDYRDQLKDESEATALEQAGKAVTDAKGVEVLINQAYEAQQAEPDNLNHYRQLSELYHRSGDYQSAIGWIQEARKMEAGQGDVALEERERDLTLEYYDDTIDQWQAALAADPESPANKAGLEQSITAKRHYHREQVESLVERYPNDYGHRHDYGRILFEDSDFDGAISQFQLAQRNANVRLEAVLYLGRSYAQKNFHDMAVEQFCIIKNEIPIMDERKKEAVYELGICYESMGKPELAIEEFKAVYQNDVSFRDVQDKINAFYAAGTGG